MLAIPYSFVVFAKTAVCLGKSVFYFPVNLGVSCDGTPQISELMNCFQLSSTNGDVGSVVLFYGWRQVKDLSLLQADLESKELGSLCKAGSKVLQFSFSAGNEGSIVSEEEVTEQLLECFCTGMQSPEVKQTTVKTVGDVYSTIMVKKMLNSVGAITQPCFMPLMMGKDPERLLFNLIWPHWSLCSWITMVGNFGGQLRHTMILLTPFLLPVSNALVRSINAIYSPLFCSLHFSWSYLRMNTMSVVPLLALNPHWVSSRWSSVMVGTNLFKNTWARIFSKMESSVISQYLEQSDFSPLFLYKVMMITLWSSLGSLPCSQQLTRSLWSLRCNAGPPTF